MKKVNLVDLCDIVIGRTPSRNQKEYWGKGHPWVSISDMKEKQIWNTKEEITDEALKQVRCRLIPKGTLLFSFKLTIGKMAFASRDLYTNEAIAGLKIKDPKRLSSEYLYYVLKVAKLLGANQAAMGKTLNTKSLAAIKVPLPDKFNDQVRIVTLLGRVEALISTRKRNLELLDDFLKSTFLEMFGDPVRNEMEWITKTLPEIAHPHKNALKRGPFGGALKKEIFVDSGYLVYEQNHALNNDYSFQRYFIDEQKYNELIGFRVVPGDILISCSGIYLGKLSIVPDGALPGIINQALLKVSLNTEIMKQIFFVYLFGSPQIKNKYFPSNRGGAIPNLPPMKEMKKIDFICPPINHQIQFGTIVEKVEGIKSCYQKNLTYLENLYSVLSQKVFKGELNLSRVPLSDENIPKVQEVTHIDQVSVTDEVRQFVEHPMSVLEERENLLRNLFDEHLKQYKGENISLDNFWQEANFKMIDLMDEFDRLWGVEDYDQITQWLFELVNEGKIEQTQNIVSKPDEDVVYGNEIVLKALN